MSPGPRTGGVFFLYSLGAGPDPTAVTESVTAFRRHSRFPVQPLNALLGFPLALRAVSPQAIVLHYTMFYDGFGRLGPRFREYIRDNRDSYVVAMFQDEQADLAGHARLCTELGVDCISTMFGGEQARAVYGETGADRILSHIPGYVSDELRAVGRRLSRPDGERTIDIGYRGRRPPPEWGTAAQEKYEIALGFERGAAGRGLALDIATTEAARIYGEAWYRFMGNCRATLGTESGTEIEFRGETLPYRMISPRHLEAAALGSCQILFDGHYSGLLEPMTHYIPLRKDFSNVGEVLERFGDRQTRTRISAAARAELIESERFTYRSFVAQFDDVLMEAGLTPKTSRGSFASSIALHSPRPLGRGRLWVSRAARLARRTRARLTARVRRR